MIGRIEKQGNQYKLTDGQDKLILITSDLDIAIHEAIINNIDVLFLVGLTVEYK